MAISLRNAYLHREIVLDKKKRPIVNGRKAAFIREQIIDSKGRVVKSRTRDISRDRIERELVAR
jgi:hypothetical protein